MAADSLCIGDNVCFYSEESYGFVYSLQTSSIHAELAVEPRQHREKPSVPDPQVISFEVCVANRYKLNKKYRKLKEKSDAANDDLALKTQVSSTQIGAEAEAEDNLAEQKRQQGKKVLYGQIIQLQHVFTGKYVHVSTTQTSVTESSNMQVELCMYNAKHSQFRIMPRYKVKAEGDVVQVGDQVVLESVKSPGQYLHVGKAQFGSQSVYSHSHEVNLSVRQSGFTIYRRYKPEKDHANFLKAGIPIRLFHKEIEAYLVSEGLFDEAVTEDVHLRMRAMDQNNPKTLFPSTSAITYWQLEMEDGPINGNVVRWEQQCRFKHMTTRKYLIADGKKVTLTNDPLDPKTVFRLHPVIKEKDQIEYETYCRVEHVVTGTWLHASTEEYQRSQTSSSNNDASMASLTWTNAALRQICVTPEMQYDDAFTMQHVERAHLDNFNYMAGMVPFIQKIIEDKKAGATLSARDTLSVKNALGELKKFMIINGDPNKQRQKLLRNLRIVELLVQLLRVPYRGAPDQNHLTTIMVECYDVLYIYLMGNSRKNELYIAKHIDFFESQISYEGAIGLNAAHMVMELVKDNRKIVDRITHKHIDNFVELLMRNKNYRYLDLLSVLCVCDGVSIPDNQKYITEAWLMKGQKNCVYHTELGQKIGKDSNVVYVSKDNQRRWTAFHDFVAQNPSLNRLGGSRTRETNRHVVHLGNKTTRDLEEDEEFLFLDHQLDLFGKLCYGRNEFAINVITEELGYLTWDEAYLCLTNDQLPDQLRAKYCHLIIALFVDVGENAAVLDKINLTFVWDEVGSNEMHASTQKDQAARDKSTTQRYFPVLRDWISKFLDANKDMTASLIGHNMLVEQVLRLVHYLAKYGYYGEMSDVRQLLEPLLSLVDGRNDKPYPNKTGTPLIKDVMDHYSRFLRYKESPETKAIVDAKYQAMEVLDLFFNYSFNTRLEVFVNEFKSTYAKANQVGANHPELAALLYEDFDIYTGSSSNHTAMRRLKEMMAKSAFFSEFRITDVLMDLSNYEYDKMVVKSMTLLNRHFSSHDNLFKRAVQAQVLITDSSATVLQDLHTILPTMQRLTSAKMSADQTKTMADILEKLIGYCTLENEPEERHPMNQSILYNHGILTTVFDILSQEIDIKLLEQYSGIRGIFQRSFKLLEALARGNDVVQQRLFDRLDMLLNIKGAEAEMADALTEVFTGNKQTCLKILDHQVQKIMSLVAQHTNQAPQFLQLLNAIVKVEELNLPLKRNQGYVMKYFMQYRAEVAHVIDQSSEKRKSLLSCGPSPDLDYLIVLVDLLATCAEGENRFIESICQTIFDVKELLDILNDKKIDSNLKRPYLRFFLWVYLNTAGGMIESGAGDLPHDKSMWEYVNSLNDILTALTQYAQTSSETVKFLLKKAPGKSPNLVDQIMDDPDALNTVLSEQGQGDWKKHHGSLHYLMEAVFPFLQVFFHTYYQPDRENFPHEADFVDKLSENVMDFTKTVGPLVCNPTHMKIMVGCMNVLLSASTLPVKVMEDFQEKYGNGVNVQDVRSDARRKYEEYYQQEEELNSQLNIFAINYSVVYGGFNDVRTQIGDNMDKDYTEIGGDEELPLGQEFQEHVGSFITTNAKNPGKKYSRAGKLVEQLSISASNTTMNEKERLNQEELDIKCLQLLRAMIHNEVVKLPDDWESNLKANKRTLKKIEDVQSSLNAGSALLKVLPHLSKNGDDIVREVLAFLAAMLFGGNEQIQQSLVDYFLGTREENFFFAVKNRMQLSAVATKEKRSLQAQHQAKIDEALEQAKALRKAMKSGKLAAEEILMANNMGSTMRGLRASNASLSGRSKSRGTDALRKRYGQKSRMGSNSSLNRSQMLGSHMLLPQAAFRDLAGSVTRLAPPAGAAIEMKPMTKREDKMALIAKDNKVAPETPPDIQIEDIDDTELKELAAMAVEPSSDLDYRDDGYIELVLKILGLTCDGQNKILQDYLREQPDNIKTVNLIAETARFLSLVYSSINNNTIGLVTELFNTLVEFTSGNLQNQMVVFDNKICDYINYILRGASFQGCSIKEVITLKKSIANAIIALTEENAKPPIDEEGKKIGITTSTTKEVAEMLDAESIWNVAVDCYTKSQSKDGSLQDELKENVMIVGFSYFHILLRMTDLNEDILARKSKCNTRDDCVNRLRKRLVKNAADQVIWDYYFDGTLSIEILKEDELQKLYFRCKDKSVLREDVKEKFKYEVDRSSPSNKLREFMDWSKDIMFDITYTRNVVNNMVSRFFVKFWWHFNMMMIFISFLFFILIMVTWREPVDASGNVTYSGVKPRYAYNPSAVEILTYALGGLHNIFTLCVLVSYFITNHPSLPRFKAIKALWAKCVHKKDEFDGDDDDDDDDEERESNLEVKVFSFKTCWYIMLFAASVLGTAFYGYFFSFHLLHMAEFNQLLKRAIQAVTKNGFSLLMVFVYGLVLIYMFALWAFAQYRELYVDDDGLFCSSMYECFITNVHRGLVIGIYEFLAVPAGESFLFHLHKAVFDIVFFIIITTIGLNIIFGIIVDTFSELRDNKWQVDNDMRTTCFICSRNSYDFEHQGGGFENHVKREHNQWAYLFFFIHLAETRSNDYTALELYVSRLLERENYDFFPLHRALSLQHEEDSNEIRLETLMNQVTFLVNRMKDEEAQKEKNNEKQKQLEWERKHRNK